MTYLVYLKEKGSDKEKKIGEYKSDKTLKKVVDELWERDTTANVRIFKEVSWGEQMTLLDGDSFPF